MTTSTTGEPALAAAKIALPDALHALTIAENDTAQLVRRVVTEQLAPQLERLAVAVSAARQACERLTSAGGIAPTLEAPVDRIAAKWGAPYAGAIAALEAVRTHVQP